MGERSCVSLVQLVDEASGTLVCLLTCPDGVDTRYDLGALAVEATVPGH